jgi:CPA2 family monovalent cation:H+ antiporter-2
MPETFSFFADLSITIAVAAGVGIFFSRYNLPLTVGYILAGLIIGPHFGPALIRNSASIQMLSDFGVMFLMFSIGLGFSFRKVRQMGGRVVFPAILDISFMVMGGFFVGKCLGWGNLECFLLGLILCDSSTSIAAKTFEGLGWTRHRFAENTFAIALIEDVLAILLIAVLNGISGGTSGGIDFWSTASVIGKQMGILVLFLVGVIVFGILLIPRLMNYVSRRFGDEIVLMTALGLCFAISCLAQEGLGLSLVVGAFLAGATVAEAQARRRIERIVRPVTDLFSSVFFVSVGLLLDPSVIVKHIGTIIFITIAMILLKLANGFIACIIVGEHPRDAFKTGISLGQVAEFSFIIAGIAMSGKMSDQPLYQIAAGVALLCTATNPYLLRYSDALYECASRFAGPKVRNLFFAYRSGLHDMEQARDDDGRSGIAQIRTFAIQIGISLTIIAILFGIVYFVAQIPSVAHFLSTINGRWQPTNFSIPWSGFLCSAAAMLITAPAFWTAQHLWRELVDCIVLNALNQAKLRIHHLRAFLRWILMLSGWVGLIIYAVLLCSPFISNIWILAAILYGASLVMTCCSKRFKHNYRISHAELARAFDVGALPREDPVNISEVLAVHTETITVPRFAHADGKTLGELNLRGETGAAVISVSIPGRPPIVSPGRDTRIETGASLVVVGSDNEIRLATDLLTRPAEDTL